ncbi:MAG: hypothetical protein KME59_12125 [Trichormus sp. ATA11-4-KO1]|jgi:hypothetical protein|nr:hypothetical protein [Trichormus sp. ATA11-4-KO1]
MKNKFLAIFAVAGIAAVGSALFSAPAHAQLAVDQDVNVELEVPEVLYLRTFETLSLTITEDELAGGTAVTTGGIGQDFDSLSPISDGTTLIDQTSPFGGLTGGSITKPVAELFAVWSNNPDGGVNVTLTPTTTGLTSAGGGTATIVSVTKTSTDPTTAPGLETPYVGGADIEFDLNGATVAETYTGGVINVSVEAP